MDSRRFAESKAGELVRIEFQNGQDWAFIPAPLPREWEIPTAALHTLLGDARERLGKLDGIGQSQLNPALLLRPLQQREAIRSSSLEGTHVGALELLQYQRDPGEPTSEHDRRNAWREVSNHEDALNHGVKRIEGGLPICNRLIKELHSRLFDRLHGANKRPGEFRDRQVHVGSDRRFVPPPASSVENLMRDLERFLNDSEAKTNPLVRAYMAHYQFEAIHPFLDGNGRIGRVLLSLCISLWHQHSSPWLYMSAYFDRYKDEYVDNLFRVSTHGDWERWIEFCLRGTVAQCDDAILRCTKLGQLRDQFHHQTDSLSPRMRRIIDAMFEYGPVFQVKDVQRICDVSRPTAQADINKLMSADIVAHLEGSRPRTYFVPGVIAIAFHDD